MFGIHITGEVAEQLVQRLNEDSSNCEELLG